LPGGGGRAETYTSAAAKYDRGVSDPALAVTALLPPGAGEAILERTALSEQADVAARLRAEDPTLWAPAGTPEVADRLGWLTIAERMLADLPELEAFAAEVRADGIADLVLLGMGGSSLAPEVLRRSFAASAGGPTLHVLDSTDASAVADTGAAIDPERTLFIVSSKSGGTIEPLSLFAHFFSLVGRGTSYVAITDPGSGLEGLAHEHGFRRVFAGDPDIGGRYSALSPFGVVPAVLAGIDAGGLLRGAAGAWTTPLDPSLPGAAHAPQAGVWLGAALSALARAGRDKLTFVIGDTLPGLGLWLEQLVAESTGKQGTGILPVAEEPLVAATRYGSDRVFAHLPDLSAPDPAVDAAMAAVAQAGHPVITIPTHGPGDLGRLFLLAEIAVAVAGWGLDINPFDQPNVQQAKDATKRVLGEYEQRGAGADIADLAPSPSGDAAVGALLGGAASPEYVALMAYAEPSAAIDAAASELRAAIVDATGATTTFGYGPRFLHSTGQFHKGGPREGRFLQLLHDGPSDVAIPGAPYSFATLKEAQAIGDLQTLRELGLPAERVRLAREDPAATLRALAAGLGGKGSGT
jgi:glucose-6-phosphate isomerase